MIDVKEQVNRVGRGMAEQGLKFEYLDTFDKPVIALSFGGGDFSYTHVQINVVFDEDGESAQIATSPIASVPAEKTSRMLLALNECNSRFRWVKFYLDSDNDVIADGDVILDEQNAAAAVIEMVMRTASIIDDAYGDIMRGIWG